MALQINRAGQHRALLNLWDKQSVLLQTGLDYGRPGLDTGGQVGSRARHGGCRVHLPILGCFRRRQIRASRSSF